MNIALVAPACRGKMNNVTCLDIGRRSQDNVYLKHSDEHCPGCADPSWKNEQCYVSRDWSALPEYQKGNA